jgi:monothiol glutaredoxin
MGVEYKDVNVLADDAVRQSIKEYSDWPTIPQLYVKGEFIGGCDIIRDMTLSGEFDGMLAENNINYDKAAAKEIRKANSA